MNTNFEDRLLAALLREHERLTTTAAPSTAGTVPSRRPRLRLATASAATVGVAAAAAVIVTVDAATLSPARAPAPARSPSHTPRPTRSVEATTTLPARTTIDVAYVVHTMQEALNANTDVLHQLVYAPDSQTGAPTIEETWTRGGTNTTHTITLNPQGQPVTGALVTITPHTTTSILIDYASRSYTKRTYPFGTDTPNPGPGPAPATPTGQAATLRAQVADGQVTLIGSRTVNGQQALALRDTSSKYGVIELWVDPTTYLPIQEIDIPTGASADSEQSIRTESQWLPATQTNLAELTPNGAIPPGFQPANTN